MKIHIISASRLSARLDGLEANMRKLLNQVDFVSKKLDVVGQMNVKVESVYAILNEEKNDKNDDSKILTRIAQAHKATRTKVENIEEKLANYTKVVEQRTSNIQADSNQIVEDLFSKIDKIVPSVMIMTKHMNDSVKTETESIRREIRIIPSQINGLMGASNEKLIEKTEKLLNAKLSDIQADTKSSFFQKKIILS